MCDQQTYDHYPENVRLTGEALATAQQMVKVDANKKKVKMHLTQQNGKPVLLKNLHNIQTKALNDKRDKSGNDLRQLFDILTAIPNANVCFITDEEDDLVGKL